jgi:putative membrane protein
MDLNLLVKQLLATTIFSVLGMIILILGFVIADKMTPYDLWREIVEKQNTSLAIMVGLFGLGVAIIIAAALHG